MIHVLYIDCCIRGELSRTKKLAETFLAELSRSGAYAVERLTLMDEPLVPFQNGFFRQREELLEAGELGHPRFRYAHQFKAAERVVIAAPFWDLSFPALLKVYIENLCVQGITFDCDEKNGTYGVCKAERMLFLTTRGGALEGSPMDNGTKYLSDMSKFFGIPRFDHIAADGLDLGLEPVETILNRAIERAKEIATDF
ncbi:FMN-dependent NADH-azoreductase [bioreactor metagenome]|uniref:FMN-dependent NADH-azoreductase n=1 Tax=bioreactor metagenome TaxID=1076179 RepID=A0A645A2P2_9ZZZZ